MNDLATTETSNIAIKLNSASQALAQATSDFERIEIRDTAKAIQAASEILKRKDIQVQASLLVTDAERAIVKANPSRQGERTDKNFVTSKDDVISQSNLRNMRQAHDSLSDTEFGSIKSEAIESEEPLTRSKLQKITKDKRQKQNRAERDIKLESSNTQLPDGTQKYGIIYADPPYRYDFSNTKNREIENHYPTNNGLAGN